MKKLSKEQQLKKKKVAQKRADYTKARAGKKHVPKVVPNT